MDIDEQFKKLAATAFVVTGLLFLGLLGGSVWVIGHFVSKYW